jgi:hypothetical protein
MRSITFQRNCPSIDCNVGIEFKLVVFLSRHWPCSISITVEVFMSTTSSDRRLRWTGGLPLALAGLALAGTAALRAGFRR